jgi:hypothetical protein
MSLPNLNVRTNYLVFTATRQKWDSSLLGWLFGFEIPHFTLLIECVYIYIYIYIYREREREGGGTNKSKVKSVTALMHSHTMKVYRLCMYYSVFCAALPVALEGVSDQLYAPPQQKMAFTLLGFLSLARIRIQTPILGVTGSYQNSTKD